MQYVFHVFKKKREKERAENIRKESKKKTASQ